MRAPVQPALIRTLSNLAFAYLLDGQSEKAWDCFDLSRKWIKSGRSWAMTIEFFCESASLQLAFGHWDQALELIRAADQTFLGRTRLVVNLGALERFKVLLAYEDSGRVPAEALALESRERFRNRHPMAYLECLAALAWLQKKSTGVLTEDVRNELNLFEEWNVKGKRKVLLAQGILDG